MNHPTSAVLVVGLLAAAASPVLAQSMEEKRAQKLASPFLKKAAWITDYDAALAEAKKTTKLIFAYFTRSYSP